MSLTCYSNGQMTEYIAAGTSKDEFIRRLMKTFQSSSSQTQPASTPVSAIPPAASQPSHRLQSTPTTSGFYDRTQPTTVTRTASNTPAASSPTTPQGGQPSTTEADKHSDAEKKAKARADAEEETRRLVDGRGGYPPKNAEQDHANENKLRKQHADEERKRILKRIEDDKRARKEREAEERRARQLLSANANDESAAGVNPTASIPLARRMPKAGRGDHCSLQVRLLDGSTIRTRFPSDKTLAQDVRKWIDEERMDGDAPYSFRVVLTPLPNKVIEPQEEIKSLLSLGFTPSATLVLIPVRHSVAYAHGRGILTPVVGVFSTLYGAILASLGGIFTFLFGGANTARPHHTDIPMENLRAQRRDAQLYNGNSVGIHRLSIIQSNMSSPLFIHK
jgi:hypothetical protein